MCIKVHSDEDDFSQQVNEINKHLKKYISIYIYENILWPKIIWTPNWSNFDQWKPETMYDLTDRNSGWGALAI